MTTTIAVIYLVGCAAIGVGWGAIGAYLVHRFKLNQWLAMANVTVLCVATSLVWGFYLGVWKL